MENPPDLWYSKADHSLTRTGLRWHLAEDDLDFADHHESNHVYFVNIDPYCGNGEENEYIVALLHHLVEDNEYDEPVPIGTLSSSLVWILSFK
jgi:hypothetical protein